MDRLAFWIFQSLGYRANTWNIIEKEAHNNTCHISFVFGQFWRLIGRFLRWNSWDIITNPFNLMYDVGDRIVNPTEHPQTWGMTIFMGLFLIIVYLSFRVIIKRTTNCNN